MSVAGMFAERWVRQVSLLVFGVLCMFSSTTLLVAVIPPLAERIGGSSAAGIATAAFYFPAVCVQLSTPYLLRRCPTAPLLVTGLLLAGAPSLLYIAVKDNLGGILVTTALRGVGFGIGTVALLTLVAQVAPPGRRGTAIGTAGLAAGLPFVFGAAAGTYLFELGHEDVAFAAAAAVAVLGALAVVRVVRPELPDAVPLRLREALRTTSMLWPFAWFVLVSLTRGAVISFIPIRLAGGGIGGAASFFLVFGLLGYVARWSSGWLADRVRPERLIVPGVLCVLGGLVLIAAGEDAAYVLPAAVLYGIGTGTLMTLSQLDLLARASLSSFAVPTAVWNVSIDFGVGLGGVLFGVLVAVTGYDVGFWLLPAVIGVVLVIVALEPRPERE